MQRFASSCRHNQLVTQMVSGVGQAKTGCVLHDRNNVPFHVRSTRAIISGALGNGSYLTTAHNPLDLVNGRRVLASVRKKTSLIDMTFFALWTSLNGLVSGSKAWGWKLLCARHVIKTKQTDIPLLCSELCLVSWSIT